jgi:hypothetical protein
MTRMAAALPWAREDAPVLLALVGVLAAAMLL